MSHVGTTKRKQNNVTIVSERLVTKETIQVYCLYRQICGWSRNSFSFVNNSLLNLVDDICLYAQCYDYLTGNDLSNNKLGLTWLSFILFAFSTSTYYIHPKERSWHCWTYFGNLQVDFNTQISCLVVTRSNKVVDIYTCFGWLWTTSP